MHILIHIHILSQTKSWFFEKISQIERKIQESKFKIGDGKGIVTTIGISEIQNITRKFFEKCIFQITKKTRRNGCS